MKKINIVKRKEDFNKIIKTTKPYKTPFLSIYNTKNDLGYARFGISVPKKYGIAVDRNKIKRQLKEIIDSNKFLFKKSYDYIIIVKNDIKTKNFKEMKDIVMNMFDQIEKRGN